MLKRLIVFLTAAIFLNPVPAMPDLKTYYESLGSDPWKAFNYELPLLPPYCKCRVGKHLLNADQLRQERGKWDRIFKSKGVRGEGWIHVHHYCAGLLMLSRLQRGVGERSALLAEAESQFNYMIKNTNKEFILMPEIYLKMGMTQIELKQPIKAIECFKRAISLKKDYVPAYIQLIDLFMRSQNINEAISTAKTGLEYSPDSEQLQKKLVELQSLSQ